MGDGDTKVEVGSWEQVPGPPQRDLRGMPGCWAGAALRGRTPQAQRAGNPAWEAGAVSSILTTTYFRLVNITLMTNNLNFTCFGQQRFLKPPLLCIYARVCENTRPPQIFLLTSPPAKRLQDGRKAGLGKSIAFTS